MVLAARYATLCADCVAIRWAFAITDRVMVVAGTLGNTERINQMDAAKASWTPQDVALQARRVVPHWKRSAAMKTAPGEPHSAERSESQESRRTGHRRQLVADPA